MKKRKIIIAGMLLALTAALATGCKDDDRDDSLEDRVEQLEQQVTDLKKNNTGSVGTENNTSTDNNTGAGSNADSDAKVLNYETLKDSVNDISEKINAAAPSGSASEQREQYYNLKQELNSVDQQLDLYDDELENQYHSGSLTASDYRDKERQIDELEDILDTAEDKLEQLFGIDD